MSQDDAVEPVIGEVVISEAGPFEEERQIWVYAQPDDFKITIPVGARMTFGYFNPAAAGPSASKYSNHYQGPGSETMKTTCLRIYADTTDKRQLAAFLGVSGFRDMTAVQKTLMRRKVTIELNHEDDGMGNAATARKQLAEGNAVNENDLF